MTPRMCRRKINQQRRILAVRVKARAAMDKAVLHHRLGQPIPPVDHLAVKVQRVLRPNCKPERQQISPRNGLGDYIPVQIDEGLRGKDDVQRAGDVDDMEYQRAATTGTSVDRNFPLQNENFRPIDAVPSKPDGPRSRSHNGRNRRIHVKKPGNTMVVFASVPSVTVEARPKHSSGNNDELHGFDGNVQFTPSVKTSHGCEGGSPGASPVVTPDQRQLPWPMGRRWW